MAINPDKIVKRIAQVAVSPAFLIKIMQQGLSAARIVDHPIPDDAVFLGSVNRDGLIWLVLASESFDEIEQGDPVPELPTPTFSKLAPLFYH